MTGRSLSLQVRVALRECAGLPRLVWGGDHVDEGHRKLFAAELLASRAFIPDDGNIQNGFLFLDAGASQSRRVPGFSKRGLVVILKRMKLTKKPTFAGDIGDLEDGIKSGGESDVVLSDYSDDAGPDDSFEFSFDASAGDGADRTGFQAAADVGNESVADGEDRAYDDKEHEDAVVRDSDVEDSHYWGLGDEGQGARWDDNVRK